ncbi:MAG: DUF3536 domain-containing protein [bacterium]|nr:DUF3536 domain-containing protein [bacterium]
MNHYICIHGHFYQPPRENPWLEEVELQDSAYPYHDWNERITTECYAPNSSARILDSENRITDIVSNYARISFNFGPTLLSWMERHSPEVYQAVLDADRESQKWFSGHGSALAQAYNHLIMPLANRRDKRTQVVWGIRDFEHRFRRKPEGMWLPETAVDLETLDILSENGIKFTILAPGQARRHRPLGSSSWQETGGGIDPNKPYLCRLPSGRSIAIFFYNGSVAHDVAFGPLLSNGENFAQRLLSAFNPSCPDRQFVSIATDGETFGHHHRFGDMALAYCLYYIESRELAKITIYGEYLEKFPPADEVEIRENTSWSCAHGVERWRKNCGCNIGSDPKWNQEWRTPLREAMDWLRDKTTPIYEREMALYFADPWQIRDDYIEIILNRSVPNVERFLSERARGELSREDKARVLGFLEMQRCALLMYTSCGWFFDDISGLEPIQVMMYAARALQLAAVVGKTTLEPEYLRILGRAQSNLPALRDGAAIYQDMVRPAVVNLPRVGVHYAVLSLFEEYPATLTIYHHLVSSESYERFEAGSQRLAVGRVRIRSEITWAERTMDFAVLHLGDHNVMGGMREYESEEKFAEMKRQIKEAFFKSNLTEIISLLDKYFQHHDYSLWHLFKDDQRKVINKILNVTLKVIEASFRQIYDHHYPMMQVISEMRMPQPKGLAMIMEFVLNSDLRELLDGEEDLDLKKLQRLIEEIKRWGVVLDRPMLSYVISRRVNFRMEKLAQAPENVFLLEHLYQALTVLSVLSLELDIWKAQNICFSIGKLLYEEMQEKAGQNDQLAKKWIELFVGLEKHLRVNMEWGKAPMVDRRRTDRK